MQRGDIRRYKRNCGVPPLFRQPQKDISTTREAREEEEQGRGKKEIRSGGVVEDRTQPVEEVRTATPSSSPKRTKKKNNNRDYRGNVTRT